MACNHKISFLLIKTALTGLTNKADRSKYIRREILLKKYVGTYTYYLFKVGNNCSDNT